MRLLQIAIYVLISSVTSATIDENGYVIYCPCMGRFGNQVDHFLGSLAFARDVNRTLILPPWVEYVVGEPEARMVDFDVYFDITSLRRYHRVIVMRDFMKTHAHKVWPSKERYVFCHSKRASLSGDQCDDGGCCHNDGNPFGAFWRYSGIVFNQSIIFGEKIASFNTDKESVKQQWIQIYSPRKFPVLAFTGAPANFPVDRKNAHLQKYLQWSEKIATPARNFVDEHFGPSQGPFIGIHLRNDKDWNNVCKLVTSNGNMHIFASPQCLGQNFAHGKMSSELCDPSKSTIMHQLRQAIIDTEATAVFVASDRDHMIEEIKKELGDLKIRVVSRNPDEPHISLAILTLADYYIGNCVSSFSAFVKRARDAHQLPSGFWAFEVPALDKSRAKSEL